MTRARIFVCTLAPRFYLLAHTAEKLCTVSSKLCIVLGNRFFYVFIVKVIKQIPFNTQHYRRFVELPFRKLSCRSYILCVYCSHLQGTF